MDTSNDIIIDDLDEFLKELDSMGNNLVDEIHNFNELKLVNMEDLNISELKLNLELLNKNVNIKI